MYQSQMQDNNDFLNCRSVTEPNLLLLIMAAHRFGIELLRVEICKCDKNLHMYHISDEACTLVLVSSNPFFVFLCVTQIQKKKNSTEIDERIADLRHKIVRYGITYVKETQHQIIKVLLWRWTTLYQ